MTSKANDVKTKDEGMLHASLEQQNKELAKDQFRKISASLQRFNEIYRSTSNSENETENYYSVDSPHNVVPYLSTASSGGGSLSVAGVLNRALDILEDERNSLVFEGGNIVRRWKLI